MGPGGGKLSPTHDIIRPGAAPYCGTAALGCAKNREAAQPGAAVPHRRTRAARAHRPGNALIEFVLTLPIIVFMAGTTMYMSFAMLTRQQALCEARYRLWNSANNDPWSPMKLEGFDPGSAGAVPRTGYGSKPRGTGDELDQLRADVQSRSLAKASNARARDYWERLWDNLPGRSDIKVSRSFTSSGSLWNFIDHTATADHFRDSSPWHYYHIDAWKIARSGPLKEIFDAFHNGLQGTVAPHFQATRDDIIKRWWHGSDILDDDLLATSN